jgi:hypothetical protein
MKRSIFIIFTSPLLAAVAAAARFCGDVSRAPLCSF